MEQKAWKAEGSALRIPGYATLVVFDKPSHARLCAAAPDMLAALKGLLEWWNEDDMDQEVYDAAEKQALSAIAKAEGRD